MYTIFLFFPIDWRVANGYTNGKGSLTTGYCDTLFLSYEGRDIYEDWI